MRPKKGCISCRIVGLILESREESFRKAECGGLPLIPALRKQLLYSRLSRLQNYKSHNLLSFINDPLVERCPLGLTLPLPWWILNSCTYLWEALAYGVSEHSLMVVVGMCVVRGSLDPNMKLQLLTHSCLHPSAIYNSASAACGCTLKISIQETGGAWERLYLCRL